MPDDKIVILHYDSCTYKQWYNKFNLLKDTDEEKMKKIPFNFYKDSIKKLQNCQEKDKVCNYDLQHFFKEQKVNKYYKNNSLVNFNAPNIEKL